MKKISKIHRLIFVSSAVYFSSAIAFPQSGLCGCESPPGPPPGGCTDIAEKAIPLYDEYCGIYSDYEQEKKKGNRSKTAEQLKEKLQSIKSEKKLDMYVKLYNITPCVPEWKMPPNPD